MFALDVTYLGALVGGLLSFLSPCVLPLVPPYLAYLAGTSMDDITGEGALRAGVTGRLTRTAVVFVLGFTTVFVALGATASALSAVVTDNAGLLSRIAGAVIVVFGLHFIGVVRIPLLYREARINVAGRPAGLIGAYLMGLAFAFGWTPCVGPVLAAILTVAADKGSIGSGAALLTVYSAGLGLPFIVAALGARPFLGFMRRFRAHMRKVEIAMGALLIATGAMMLAGTFQDLGFWLLEAVPSLGTLG
jgi:cytochrome c-type biogenesis protein